MRSKLNKIIFSLFILNLGLIPSTISAASLSVSSGSPVSSGDTSIIEVYLNTEGQAVNSVDGAIVLSDSYQGNFEIKDISLTNSAFTMWPRKPSVGEGHKVSFVGGLPGGISGNRLLLFKLIVKINKAGEFKITPENMVMYLNDGLGTAVNLEKNVLTINVGESRGDPVDKWQDVIAKDNTAPERFEISLNQDPNLFDGKKFISFETTDVESGVDYYEVKEGSYGVVRTGTNYVLIEQEKELKIVVYAFDKAGNFQVATMNDSDQINWLGVIVVLLVVVVARKIILRIKHKNINKDAK